jgi:GNAT superfamily N-acetyltransferase
MTITYRPATRADLEAMQDVLVASIDDFVARMGQGDPEPMSPADEAALRERRRPTWEHLDATADACWVAEDARDSGQLAGYGRSIVRGHVRELTELFVRPEAQGRGIGGELLARVFPAEADRNRVIIATTHPPALARYLRTGVTVRFAIGSFSGPLGASVPLSPDADLRPAGSHPAVLEALGAIDDVVLGHRRGLDHRFLLDDRACVQLWRDGRVVGYGYHGRWQGSVAALDPEDLPVLLAAVERESALAGHSTLALDVPLLNSAALRHLLARGFRLDPLVSLFLSDEPIGRFDRYVCTTPPLFL